MAVAPEASTRNLVTYRNRNANTSVVGTSRTILATVRSFEVAQWPLHQPTWTCKRRIARSRCIGGHPGWTGSSMTIRLAHRQVRFA
jgi:hypothetical protein